MTRLTKATVVAMLLAVAAIGLASGIKWNTKLDAALKIAKKTHRPVMVDFYGEH